MNQAPSKYTRQALSTAVTQVHGVGPRIAEKLAKLGIETVEDVLFTLPHRYEDRREFRKIARLREGMHEVFAGEILAAGELTTARTRRRIYEVIVGDESGRVSLKWFHYRKSWMDKRFAKSRKAVCSGEVKRFGLSKEVHHPDVEFLDSGQSLDNFDNVDPLTFGRILPVYPLTEGLTQLTARKIWKQVVEKYAPLASSHLPAEIRHRFGLMSIGEALQEIHWPGQDADINALNQGQDPARKTLVFDELFFLELGLALKKHGVAMEQGRAFAVHHIYTKPLASMLPYRLTQAQRRVLGEIKRDLTSGHPMNRLVQGDVGCGKTIVALMTALVAIENRTQVAIVAPTEILAEQHFLQFHPWLDRLGLQAALLRSKMPAPEKRKTLAAIAAGEIHLAVGTHAVLQEGVEFADLGLGIVDEQHRFGVKQRAVLREKGLNPHILVMTATPIPRTLSLTLYGDLALSIVDELPPGRSPVSTTVIGEKHRHKAYDTVRREMQAGHQVFLVYPLVEESEKSDLQAATEGAEYLKNEIFPQARIGLLHGRLPPDQKEAVMEKFRDQDLDILVATTVIEVGIDIPNATVMIVEHAERFGLAQLHQLRGRIGRGHLPGQCILIKSPFCSEDGEKRLQVMSQTTDGFQIAEADLEIRGPGDFLGTRQSGLPGLRVANLLRDGLMLEQAREAAFRLVEEVPDLLTNQRTVELSDELTRRWGNRLELARVG